MSDVKLLVTGVIIAVVSLWLGAYVLSFAAPNNFWFVYPTLITMACGIIGGIALVKAAIE